MILEYVDTRYQEMDFKIMRIIALHFVVYDNLVYLCVSHEHTHTHVVYKTFRCL